MPNRGQLQNRPLTDAQRIFVHRYLVHHNASRAYREAFPGASHATAYTEGPKLTTDPRISSEIKLQLESILKRYGRSAEETMQQLALVAFGNILDAFDENGALLPIEDLPREVAASIKKIERIEIKGTDSSGKPAVIGHKVKIELLDKLVALRLLGQHFGLFHEQLAVAPSNDFADLMREARQRAQAGASK